MKSRRDIRRVKREAMYTYIKKNKRRLERQRKVKRRETHREHDKGTVDRLERTANRSSV